MEQLKRELHRAVLEAATRIQRGTVNP
jgi:hypothetical protein